MKQLAPVHFVAGFFEAIAPNAQRMRRKTKHRGILGVPHAAPVHRFDMHAPERPKSNRFAGRCARCSDSAVTSGFASTAPSCPVAPAFPGANSADVPYVCADLPG